MISVVIAATVAPSWNRIIDMKYVTCIFYHVVSSGRKKDQLTIALLWFYTDRTHAYLCFNSMWANFRCHRVNIWFDNFMNSMANATLCCDFICLFINRHNTPRHLIKRAFMCKGDCNQSNRINICWSGNGAPAPKVTDLESSQKAIHCLRKSK